jgi:hypothetical protein
MPLGGHCAFLAFSTLLFGRLSNAAFIGLQFRVASGSLQRLGCSLCYDDSLESSTTATNITSCSGPNLFVGVKCLESDTFVIGAYAPAREIFIQIPQNTPHLHNGVYWYYSAGRYLGFSDAADLDPLIADGLSSICSDHQMLWSIDQASVSHAFVSNETWTLRKAIYDCPEGMSIVIYYVFESTTVRGISIALLFLFCDGRQAC